MTRGQIWQKFPKLLRFMALFPSLLETTTAMKQHKISCFSLSFWLVISRLLARTCCSLAAVVSAAVTRQVASITWCDLFRPKFGQKMRKMITSHDVLEPLKQVLSASRDVIISGQICGSNRGKFFTLGDGCWLPCYLSIVARWRSRHFTAVTALAPQEVELEHPKVVVSWLLQFHVLFRIVSRLSY